MSIAVQQIPLPNERVVALDIREPGIIRHVAIGGEEAKIAVPGQPRFQERVVLFAEVDPRGEERRRRFVLLTPGHEYEPPPTAVAVWCGVAISPNSGAVVYVYELVYDAETRSRLESPVLDE